ncbi:hypothetical protein FQZ97_736120 [compost metagenome]
MTCPFTFVQSQPVQYQTFSSRSSSCSNSLTYFSTSSFWAFFRLGAWKCGLLILVRSLLTKDSSNLISAWVLRIASVRNLWLCNAPQNSASNSSLDEERRSECERFFPVICKKHSSDLVRLSIDLCSGTVTQAPLRASTEASSRHS